MVAICIAAPPSTTDLPATTPPRTICCRVVTPPAGAGVPALLAGPWRSANFAGPETIVVPAIAVTPGNYTVHLTATQPNTTFTLQVHCAHRPATFAVPGGTQQ